jgi:hypothetical protein
MWNYLGYPNVTNASWGNYDVLYINPFDSCCWNKEMNSWAPMIKAIKTANPKAVVLATFHATEIWEEDLIDANKWLPEKCLMRNTNGERYGARFSTEIYTRGCHWIPRMFA